VVGRDRGQEVVGVLPADRDADDAEPVLFRPHFEPDAALRLGPRLALTGRCAGDSVHLAFLSLEGMPRGGPLARRRPNLLPLVLRAVPFASLLPHCRPLLRHSMTGSLPVLFAEPRFTRAGRVVKEQVSSLMTL